MQRNQPSKVKSKLLKINGAVSRIGIAVAEYNADVTEKLLDGARVELLARGGSRKNITVARVPGSFELPLACQRMAETGRYNAIIALGCVIKGETDHYHYIATEAARGIMNVMLARGIPIGFGVLTTDTPEQARVRSSGTQNKGTEAARAVLEVISVRKD